VKGFLSSFPVRLALTLMATLAVVGSVQYLLLSSGSEDRLIEERLQRHEAAARQFGEAYSSARRGETPMGEVQELVEARASGQGVRHVALIDRGGKVVAAADARHGEAVGVRDEGRIGSRERGPHIDRAIRKGIPTASGERDPGESRDRFEYVVAVRLPTGSFALEVDEATDVIDEHLASLRADILNSLLIGASLGFPLLFVLGGASLSRRHRLAVRGATRDPLTGLGNRHALQRELGPALAQARRAGEPVALAMLDVDRFKCENDTRGHQHGDRVLQGIAEILLDGRHADLAYRIGGDEFVLVMPDTDLDGGLVAAERVRAGVTHMDTPVTVSIGVAELPDGGSPAELLRAADKALYAAKNSGRNAVAPLRPELQRGPRRDRRKPVIA
jgi:diguanylate cyclase (GGDEF)-like protein